MNNHHIPNPCAEPQSNLRTSTFFFWSIRSLILHDNVLGALQRWFQVLLTLKGSNMSKFPKKAPDMEHQNLGFECRVCEWYWLDFLRDLKYAPGEQFRIRASGRASAGVHGVGSAHSLSERLGDFPPTEPKFCGF